MRTLVQRTSAGDGGWERVVRGAKEATSDSEDDIWEEISSVVRMENGGMREGRAAEDMKSTPVFLTLG